MYSPNFDLTVSLLLLQPAAPDGGGRFHRPGRGLEAGGLLCGGWKEAGSQPQVTPKST